jgi:molybdopterin converting factor small subunit
MVVVNFKLTDVGRVELVIVKPEKLESVLRKCTAKSGLELGGIIAIRKSRVIKGNDVVEDGDEIDVFPAISGG